MSFKRMARWCLICCAVMVGLALMIPAPAQAQSRELGSALTLDQRAGVVIGQRPIITTFGDAGLIDMPSAYAIPDGDVVFTLSNFGINTRATLTFQISQRLSGTFRYSALEGLAGNASRAYRFDRSFDISYQLWDEADWRPAVKVGLRDFGGTGIFSSEYIVASKSLAEGRVQVTGGLGFGRLGTANGFDNPFEQLLGVGTKTRSSVPRPIEEAGRVRFDELFRGDTSVFGGVTWRPNDRLTLMAEYSTDAYEFEETGRFKRNSPFNFGASYQYSRDTQLGAYYMYGSEIGLRVTYALNPGTPPVLNGAEDAPPPVIRRPDRSAIPAAWSRDWVDVRAASPTAARALDDVVQSVLDNQGLALEAIDLTATRARISLRNTRYSETAQAAGRAARVLSQILPASVEIFDITFVQEGMPTTRIQMRRSDIEDLEYAPDNAWRSYARAQIEDAGDQSNARTALATPPLTFGVGLDFSQSLFDPDAPFLFDVGLTAQARYEPRPGLVFSGRIDQTLLSNRDTVNRVSNSVLPLVRSESDDYARGTDPKLEELTATYLWRPGPNLYARATAGYLERAFVGVSGELLWKPTNSRLALGVELNAVHQREPGELFALGEGRFDNDAITGHVSAYYDWDNGFHTQLDAGRYLAGDWGSTLTLARRFANGWEVGAFMTLTDVSFDDFGEGAFDKGIFLEIPTAWLTGQPSRASRTTAIQPVLRDGGAKVRVPNRLYDLTRSDSDPELSESWGRFWR